MPWSIPKLTDELKFIKTTWLKNGYPKDIITTTIIYKYLQFSVNPEFGPDKCPVDLKLPGIGNVFMGLIKQIKRSVICCFNSVNLRVILKCNTLLLLILRTDWLFTRKVTLSKSFFANVTFSTSVMLPKDWNLESTNIYFLLSKQIIWTTLLSWAIRIHPLQLCDTDWTVWLALLHSTPNCLVCWRPQMMSETLWTSYTLVSHVRWYVSQLMCSCLLGFSHDLSLALLRPQEACG